MWNLCKQMLLFIHAFSIFLPPSWMCIYRPPNSRPQARALGTGFLYCVFSNAAAAAACWAFFMLGPNGNTPRNHVSPASAGDLHGDSSMKTNLGQCILHHQAWASHWRSFYVQDQFHWSICIDVESKMKTWMLKSHPLSFLSFLTLRTWNQKEWQVGNGNGKKYTPYCAWQVHWQDT